MCACADAAGSTTTGSSKTSAHASASTPTSRRGRSYATMAIATTWTPAAASMQRAAPHRAHRAANERRTDSLITHACAPARVASFIHALLPVQSLRRCLPGRVACAAAPEWTVDCPCWRHSTGFSSVGTAQPHRRTAGCAVSAWPMPGKLAPILTTRSLLRRVSG